jgi:DNA-binding MarR family transcriptional regulator
MNEIRERLEVVEELEEALANGVPPCDAYALIGALMRAGKSTEMRLDGALAVVGLSAVKWNALRHLMAAGGQLSLGQLAAKLTCVKSNATQLVDRLESDQLVRRLPAAEDRRSIRAEITEAGREAYGRGQRIVQRFEQTLVQEYTPTEQHVLTTLLARLSGE